MKSCSGIVPKRRQGLKVSAGDYGRTPRLFGLAGVAGYGILPRVNPKRLVLGIVAVFAGIFITDILIHGLWLTSAYSQTSYYLWRPEPELLERVLWIPRGQCLAATMLVILWAAFMAPGSLRRACLFGLCIGLFKQADVMINYAVLPIPGHLAVKWFVANVTQAVLLSVIAFVVYKPARAEVTPARLKTLQKRWLAAAAVTVLALVAVEWYYSPTPQQPVRATAGWMKALEPTWVIDSPGKPYSVQSVSDIRKDGADSLRFELRGGETFTDALRRSSFRAEADLKDFPPMRSVRWYAFSLYLPADFPQEHKWLVLAQWHGCDKRHLGEVSRNPVMAFIYDAGRFYLRIRHSPERIILDERAPARETPFETTSLPLNQWNDFVVQARWSYEGDGFVNVWWNGKQVVQYRGPVGYNDNVGPYFRFGLYREQTDKTYVAYFNQVRSGTSPEDIGFKP